MPVYDFEGKAPTLAADVFIAPNATIIGDVSIDGGSSIWFGAVLRGDIAPIRIGTASNVQDNCVIHAELEQGVRIGNNVTIGHGAILHDCTIHDDVVIGMGAIVLSGATIGHGSIVAAGSVVPERQLVPANSLIAGVPGKIRDVLSSNAQNWVARAGLDYVHLVARYRSESSGQRAPKSKGARKNGPY